MRLLTEADVTFGVKVEPDDLEIRGNAMASGDDAIDREEEDRILAELDAGNVWAWCLVTVTARWEGFEAEEYLGGCSYESSEAFLGEKNGYYADMKRGALARLNERVWNASKAIAGLEES